MEKAVSFKELWDFSLHFPKQTGDEIRVAVIGFFLKYLDRYPNGCWEEFLSQVCEVSIK